METQRSFVSLAQSVEEAEHSFNDKMHSYRSEMVKRGMAQRAATGLHVNRIPVGYRLRYTETGESSVQPDPVQAPLIHQAFIHRAAGKLSLRKILSLMTNNGLRASSGKGMSLAGFHRMLRNPFYVGMVRSGRGLVRGRHAAVVGQELFDRANRAEKR